jgi:hypothetical protein
MLDKRTILEIKYEGKKSKLQVNKGMVKDNEEK